MIIDTRNVKLAHMGKAIRSFRESEKDAIPSFRPATPKRFSHIRIKGLVDDVWSTLFEPIELVLLLKHRWG